MKKMRVTVRDVARVAQVTPQTVSRAIRNAPEVSAETRERVLKVAEELHYVKNNTATSLRCGNSRLIVIIYDHLVNVYFSIMIDYLQACFKERNYSILMLSVTEHLLDRSAYEFAVSHNAAGIVSFLEPSDEIAGLVESFVVPVLLFGRRTDMPAIDYLRTDDEEGGRLAAKRFIESGCKRSVYVCIGSGTSCEQDRFSGFCAEWEKTGRQKPLVVEGLRSVKEQFSALFADAASAPDCFFCFSDMLAFDVMCLLEKAGLDDRVPVIGFDDIQKEVNIPNRLVSIGSDKRAMAERAVEVLVSRIENGRGKRVAETFGVFLDDHRTP